jgi:major vault protein
MDDNLVRIPPFHYVHVLDRNTNLITTIEGPLSYVIQDHLKIVSGKSPLQMIQIPPRSYIIIKNPVITSSGSLVLDDFGMAKVRYGDREVRTSDTHPSPFPLYPFEAIEQDLTKIPVIKPNYAFMLRALRDFVDGKTPRQAGDEWLFPGPGSYLPRVECEVVREESSARHPRRRWE